MSQKLLAALLMLTLVGCGNKAQQSMPEVVADTVEIVSETDRLNEWFETKYEEEVMMSPIGLTFLGRKERYNEIDDMSEAAEDRQLEWKRNTVEELKSSFDYDTLSDDAKL